MNTATRRGFLGLVSASAATLLPARRAHAAADTAASDSACILTPQSEEGPYYVDPKLVRSDITEGRPGVPLALRLRVIEAGPCTPITGARVDIWQCDARGIYSAFPGQGDGHNIDTTSKTFLRGTQQADSAGWTEFKTIYPGWYAGRATHVHFKVYLDERTVLTGQTFFPEALNEFIYTNVPDYAQGRTKQRYVMNVNDRVAAGADPEHHAYCAVKEERERYVALLTLAVDRNFKASADAGPAAGGPPRRATLIKDRLAALVPGVRRIP